MTAPHDLTDDALITMIAALTGSARLTTATLIAHLSELEARNLHLAQGFRSLFGYCRHVLHFSEHEAYNRMEAVHAARRFPVILALLAEGLLHLTAVRLLAPHLKDANHLALLGGAIHKSKREVLELVARWFPSPDVASSIRKLPSGAARTAAAPAVMVPQAEAVEVSAAEALEPPEAAKARADGSVPEPRPLPAAHRPVVAPLSPERYRLQITIGEDAHDDLRCLQDLMRREIPDGDPAAIVARALKILRQDAETKAFAGTTKPRRPRGTKTGSRDIPAYVRRIVWRRDEGRCAFMGRSGRCSERSFLEFHHVQPYGHQGPATVENISLRCRAHNVYESELVFGRFDPSVVRETPENYAVSGEIAPFQNGNGCRSANRRNPLHRKVTHG